MTLALFLKWLPFFFQAAQYVPEMMKFVTDMKAIFKRDKAWTAEADAEWTKHLRDRRQNPPEHWKPRDKA